MSMKLGSSDWKGVGREGERGVIEEQIEAGLQVAHDTFLIRR